MRVIGKALAAATVRACVRACVWTSGRSIGNKYAVVSENQLPPFRFDWPHLCVCLHLLFIHFTSGREGGRRGRVGGAGEAQRGGPAGRPAAHPPRCAWGADGE